MGDFNGDGKSDLVTADQNDNKASVLLGNGNGTFQAKQDFGTGSNPESVAVGDFNGDGNKDLVTADMAATRRVFCSATATVRFRPSRTSAPEAGLYSVAVDDFNGDGKSDLVIANDTRGHGERAAGQWQRYVSGQAVLWHGTLAYIGCCGRLQRRRGERPGNRRPTGNAASMLLGNGTTTTQTTTTTTTTTTDYDYDHDHDYDHDYDC